MSPRLAGCFERAFVAVVLVLAGVGIAGGGVAFAIGVAVLALASLAVPRPTKNPALLLLGAAVLGGVLVLEIGKRVSLPETCFVATSVVALLVLVAARALDATKLLVGVLPFLSGMVVLFGIEAHARTRTVITWGEIFRAPLEDPDCVGAGGRMKPSLDVRLRSNEHPYSGAHLVTDEQGFRNAPIPSSEKRILNLGDSFSTGFELGQDEFLGPLLERRLGVRVQSAEIADPSHALWFLQKFPQPNVERVLVGICGNDPMQVDTFVGHKFELSESGELTLAKERAPFDPLVESAALVYPKRATFTASYLKGPRPAPSPLGAFAAMRLLARPDRSMPSILYSYVFDQEKKDGHKRLLDGCANLAYFHKTPSELVTRTYEKLRRVLKALAARAPRLTVILFPQKFQVHPEEWQALREFWNLADEDFDLDLAHRRVREICEAQGIECIDLAPSLRKETERGSLYFPLGDIHLNKVGTEVAADAVAERCRR